jgi:hypothetical protein
MEIIRHLSNEELINLAIQSDELSLRPTLTSLPGWARASTDRHEEYWQQQRSIVWSRISSSENAPAKRFVRRLPVLAWSSVAALALLAGFLLDQASFIPPPQKAQADPDHELLIEVERALHNDGPAALEPAALLAEEMVQEIPARSPIRKKEPTHEN